MYTGGDRAENGKKTWEETDGKVRGDRSTSTIQKGHALRAQGDTTTQGAPGNGNHLIQVLTAAARAKAVEEEDTGEPENRFPFLALIIFFICHIMRS